MNKFSFLVKFLSKSQLEKMLKTRCVILLVFLINRSCSQEIIGGPCTVGQTGAVGKCTLLTQCQQIRNEILTSHRLPETCGFQGTEPIVCCPLIKKPGDISAEKCKEYSLYGREAGSTKYVCEHIIRKRIVGGVPVTSKEFPHMAALGFETSSGEIIWSCGGSLISEQYILTAAQCLKHRDLGDIKWVKLGAIALNDTNNQQQIKIAMTILHPEHKPTAHYHDIALLKLATPVKINHFARPACLYLKSDISAQKAIATGWGKTHWGGGASNDLLKVTLDLYDHEFCNASYKNQISRKLRYGIVKDTQFCAGSESDEKDTCQGDSGGPLQIHHDDDEVKCMYDIIGITSFGKACSGSAGVYTRVSHYIKWIEDVVWSL